MQLGHGSRISGYLVPALMLMVVLLPERSVYEILSVSLKLGQERIGKVAVQVNYQITALSVCRNR